MKLKYLVSILIFVLFIVVFYYFLYHQQESNRTKTLFYNRFTGNWEKTTAEPTIKPDQFEKNPNDDGLHNGSIIRAYYGGYNQDSQTLMVKRVLPLTNNSVVEDTPLKLNSSQSIYCAPENYSDPYTGKTFSLRKLVIPVKNDEVLRAPNENIISFEHFINSSTEFTYLLIQLTKDFDKNNTNYIQKVIALDICE